GADDAVRAARALQDNDPINKENTREQWQADPAPLRHHHPPRSATGKNNATINKENTRDHWLAGQRPTPSPPFSPYRRKKTTSQITRKIQASNRPRPAYPRRHCPSPAPPVNNTDPINKENTRPVTSTANQRPLRRRRLISRARLEPFLLALRQRAHRLGARLG